MSIAKEVEKFVERYPAGQIFDYQAVPAYAESSSAVIKAFSRLVAERKLERFSKGKFYVPKKGILGKAKPTDNDLIKSVLYKSGKRKGYITGLALYNQLGLTTQMPSTITIAYAGGKQIRDFGTIRIKTIPTRAPISEKNVLYLQYLDVLKDIKKVSDSDLDTSLMIMKKKLNSLKRTEKKKLIEFAEDYYNPQVWALIGLLLEGVAKKWKQELKSYLNPTTTYKLHLDENKWPDAKDWNIY
ncbi:DUF6088 family protein [Emcibacter nanhaiensis]|uniref:AbiEi antitoxin C-terminal domain-containing protein n=1 Tax=Emcibacter nanhaiensis TaxID=1505037 RepID=A0A501PJ47_9PROT|nr:DUF6088 family protein [Emcibacter nanhaiensis]TPD60032.1 hypothetical protein FIV46_09525 [Emcibacter nanhaiensis]